MYSSGPCAAACAAEDAGQREYLDQRLDQEDQRHDRHGPMIARLRRYSRSSLRKIARTRVAAHARPALSSDVLVDQLEVDVLERVVRLADREHVGIRRHERPGDRGRGGVRVGDREHVPAAPSGCQLSTAAIPSNTLPGSASGTRVLTVSVLANSCSRSSAGRPIIRRVVLRIATRSQMRSASSRRCVVRKIVTPRRRSSTISSWTSRAATGSRPDVGSSRNSTSGSLISALATATR